MNHPPQSVYQQVIERTKGGFFRTQVLRYALYPLTFHMSDFYALMSDDRLVLPLPSRVLTFIAWRWRRCGEGRQTLALHAGTKEGSFMANFAFDPNFSKAFPLAFAFIIAVYNAER